MSPTLEEGDRLLLSYSARREVGQVAVVRLPDGVVAIKRLGRYDDRGWWVTRDNPEVGVDSRAVGSIADEDVLAVARLRLWPRPGRIGHP